MVLQRPGAWGAKHPHPEEEAKPDDETRTLRPGTGAHCDIRQDVKKF